MSKYLQIKKINKVPDKYGNHLVIPMIGLYDENGKWIKWITLNDAAMQVLLNTKININL